MSDYIKREDAIEQARRNWTGEDDWIASTEINLLKNLSSADVVEVVRCKDCKWWKPFNDNMGQCGYDMRHKDQYCDRGKRADT